MDNKLTLHCGGYGVDFDKVAQVVTPARTDSHVPIPHIEAIDLVINSLRDNGYQIANAAHALAKEGQRYFGLFELAGGDGASLHDHSLVVGVRNSHDKSFVFGLSMGAHVFVCDNLSFSGEVRVARKHTARIVADLPRLVTGAVGLLGDIRRTQEERFSRYKTVEISNPTANDLLVRAMEAKVLPVTKLPLALTEWKTPRDEEFKVGGPTLWRLYNAITEAIKGRVEPMRLCTPAIHGLFDSAAGFDNTRQRVLENVQDAEIVA